MFTNIVYENICNKNNFQLLYKVILPQKVFTTELTFFSSAS